jgi:hypothetical protein
MFPFDRLPESFAADVRHQPERWSFPSGMTSIASGERVGIRVPALEEILRDLRWVGRNEAGFDFLARMRRGLLGRVFSELALNAVESAHAAFALRLVPDSAFVVEVCSQLISHEAAIVREAVADALGAHVFKSHQRPEPVRQQVLALLRQLADSDTTESVRLAAEAALFGSDE